MVNMTVKWFARSNLRRFAGFRLPNPAGAVFSLHTSLPWKVPVLCPASLRSRIPLPFRQSPSSARQPYVSHPPSLSHVLLPRRRRLSLLPSSSPTTCCLVVKLGFTFASTAAFVVSIATMKLWAVCWSSHPRRRDFLHLYAMT